MSIIVLATSLSAVGASALTVGALALRHHLTSRKTVKEVDAGPVRAFAREHAALSGLSQSVAIRDIGEASRWNTLQLDNPAAALAEIGALQSRLTASGTFDASRFNGAITDKGARS